MEQLLRTLVTGPSLRGVFTAVFSVFVLALVVLVVLTIRWAVRRDRAGRAAWLERKKP